MTNNLLALAIVLAIATAVLAVGYRPLTSLIPRQDLDRLTQLFVLTTTAAFLSPSFWIYLLLLVMFLTFAASPPQPHDDPSAWRATLWLWLLLVVPAIPVELPGFAGINRLLDLHHIRILCWMLLIPIVLSPAPPSDRTPGSNWLDWLMIAYLVGMSLVFFFLYDATLTVGLRQLTLWLTDFLLPYWAMSRALRTPAQVKRALAAFATVTAILGLAGVFEVARGWAIYTQVEVAWGQDWDLSIYLLRDGLLRAQASTGHSLVLGLASATGVMLWIWLYRFIRPRLVGWLALLGALAGVAAALSRATWLTVALMALLVNALGGRARNLLLIGLLGAGALSLLAAFVPTFQELLDKLPLIGNPTMDTEKEYRQRLLEISLELIAQSPWVGVPNALAYMEELRQGQGIIDVVNSYIGIALSYGMVGLIPFVGLFLVSIWRMWLLRRRLGPDHEGWHLANCMITLYVMIMILIFSVSSIAAVPYVYFAMIGLAVSIERAYAGESRPTPPPNASR